jgi:bifunctional non-homologous end joining protein LigD
LGSAPQQLEQPMAKGDALSTYKSKRNFAVTAEPAEGGRPSPHALSFVVQKHAASRLHYDFRLELDGVMLSWAVPKGPSFDPKEKRMAIHVEDHPISYSSFEGTIPPKQYGAGTVIVWDNGTWEPVGDPRAGLAAGKLVFRLHGQKLEGPVGTGQDRQGRRAPRALDPVQEEGRVRARACRLRRRVSAARQRDRQAAQKSAPVAPRRSALQAFQGAQSARQRAQGGAAGEIKPQLATLAAGVPSAGEWLYEIKFDGYRLMARIDKGKVALITRGGHDWAAKMPRLVAELGELGLNSSFLDGEIVVLGANGAPDFNALQNAFDRGREAQDIVFFVFDAPFFEGQDLREVPLRDRRQLLRTSLRRRPASTCGSAPISKPIRVDPAVGLPDEMEGVIAKRADAPYVSRRSETWLKLKCKLRQEFVICGYTDRTDEAGQVGSLLLGVHDDGGKLASAGSVGTGWSGEEPGRSSRSCCRWPPTHSPFDKGVSKPGRWSKRKAGSERWVKPQLLAEVSFAEWTPDGQVRHASFHRIARRQAGQGHRARASQGRSARRPPRRPAARRHGRRPRHPALRSR